MRLKSKLGDIYEVELELGVRYFQLVAFDESQLGSDVIAVFKDSCNESILSGDFDTSRLHVDFFTHTMVDVGIKEGFWKKITNAFPVNCSSAQFKLVNTDDGIPNKEPNEVDTWHDWVVWYVGCEKVKIGSRITEYPNAELGKIYSPESVIRRITEGRYGTSKPYYGQWH